MNEFLVVEAFSVRALPLANNRISGIGVEEKTFLLILSIIMESFDERKSRC